MFLACENQNLYLTIAFFSPQIAGFINAIHPFSGDVENLTAFRFYALNPIVDPFVFIICRKSVFHHLCSLLSCRLGKGAMKTTAHCGLSLPLDNSIPRIQWGALNDKIDFLLQSRGLYLGRMKDSTLRGSVLKNGLTILWNERDLECTVCIEI